ncbi:MAG TPA: NAD-dependent epimerase/dehydratase family protein [Candidatus Dormibacteraeota bacterium]|nr:NAD-dependent epimerase/dehydratase family protein [Candidatus Dormibacteraeota bacterium]
MSWWRDKRVLVSGGAGFLGSHVVAALHARGAAEVIVPCCLGSRAGRQRRYGVSATFRQPSMRWSNSS